MIRLTWLGRSLEAKMSEHTIENSSGKQGHEQEKPQVTVKAPSGYSQIEAYHPHQKVSVLMQKALSDLKKAGQIADDSAEYVLVKGETDLQSEVTLSEAGVSPGDVLKLMVKAPPTDGDA
jgi:hypothetical protein